MIKGIGTNVIINSVKNNEYEKNGIIVKASNNSSLIGNVISVGKEVKEVSVGDKVIYYEPNSKKVFYENSEYFVLSEEDVLAII